MRIIDHDGGGTACPIAPFLDSFQPLIPKPNISLQDVKSTTSENSDSKVEQLWQWNRDLPPLLQTCMHDIITEQANRQPQNVAVESWDGILTYGELDQLSSELAQNLLLRGIGSGSRVPLCFEKSMWAVVAVLGVMKSGAAFSLTDSSQPEARLRTIVEQTRADLVITSLDQSTLGQRISSSTGQVLALSRDYFSVKQDTTTMRQLPRVSPSSPMYIIFTSGSTGKPKGVVISHENYTSGAIPRAEAVGYNSSSRVFDFPSYAFDVSIDCMVCTLASGGKVCVPSEEARMNDLSGAIRRSKANMVHMTPSVARVLDSDIIPSLDVLGLGGEAVSPSDAAEWSQHTSLVIAYGPSECTVGCTINNTVTISTGIGRGVGGVTWITDPEDHNRLVAVGEVGELLIEGPVVGIGYLDEPEKTAQAFIEDPVWLTAGHGAFQGRRGRLYKTGDLVRYENNGSGSIEFVGRKDQQVKLRGQRVELTEVEHHLRTCLPFGVKVAAEVIKVENTGAPTLIAFLSEASSPTGSGLEPLLVESSPELNNALLTINKTMGSKVPRYMVPAAFITLQHMPSLVSGKTDRKKLREIGSALPREKFSSTQVGEAHRNDEPNTEVERQLQRAWARVLGGNQKVYRQSSFFALGGDSLRAMRLVAAAREEGISVTVADIFTHPSLEDMALKALLFSETVQRDIPPFSLLEKDWDTDAALNEVAALCDICVDTIEDVYPCTPLQEALMALSAKVKEAYVAQRVVELKNIETAERLIAAFDIAQTDCPILRTRIVQVPGKGLVQVVTKANLVWYAGSNLSEYLQTDRDEPMDLGKPLVRYAVITEEGGNISFVLTMHHALYDGWSMPLVVDRVNSAYNKQSLQRPADFKHFIKYLAGMDRDKSETYWRGQLDGANGHQFPSLPWKGYQTQADSLLEEYVSLEALPASNVTIATVIRAAWALVASQYVNSTDIVFGETLTGRNAPIVGSEEIEGPMITTVPFRVLVDQDMPVAEYLQTIQEQIVEQIPHEHFGLQHIRKLSPDALAACELRTGLVLHPSADDEMVVDDDLPANRLVPAGDAEAAQEALKFNTYALMLVCSIDPQGFLCMASFDSKTVDISTMQRVLKQFKRVAQLLCVKSSGRLSDIEILVDNDICDLQEVVDNTKSDTLLAEYPGVVAAYITTSLDTSSLVPIGGVGELIIQSISEQSSLTEIAAPAWLSDFRINTELLRQSKLYRTGKLAKYESTTSGAKIHLVEIVAKVVSDTTSSGVVKKRVSATSRKQRKLRSLWSRVLRLSEDDIGLNDGFFLLGGDSIAAMKLVSEARAQELKLTVVQIFEKKTLYEMANVMEETAGSDITTSEQSVSESENQPFSLLEVESEDMTSFTENVIRPQLANQNWVIANVLPTRPLQQIAVRGTTHLPRFSTRYELIYFDTTVDKPCLQQSCQELVSQNEILRTVFVEHEGRGYSVVLEELTPSFIEYEIESDVESFTKQLCQLDVLTCMPHGSSFVKFFHVKAVDNQSSCLVFRISHAQYDEICLPIMLKQLSALYEEKPIQKTVPFSSYVSQVVRHNIPESVSYWTDLLAGSSLSTLKPQNIPLERRNHFAIQRTIDISSRPRDITVASIPTAAWALCLARRLSIRDVTFGEVVSGRNIEFPAGAADTVTGPCWQYVPVRVQFPPDCTALDILGAIQHQHVASSAHEGMGLSEIASYCTDWPTPDGPEQLWFDSVVHQDVEHVESLSFAATNSNNAAATRLETMYVHEEPLREWKIQAFAHAGGDKMTLEIVTFDSWGEYAEGLLDDLVDAMSLLVQTDTNARLFAPKSIGEPSTEQLINLPTEISAEPPTQLPSGPSTEQLTNLATEVSAVPSTQLPSEPSTEQLSYLPTETSAVPSIQPAEESAVELLPRPSIQISTKSSTGLSVEQSNNALTKPSTSPPAEVPIFKSLALPSPAAPTISSNVQATEMPAIPPVKPPTEVSIELSTGLSIKLSVQSFLQQIGGQVPTELSIKLSI